MKFLSDAALVFLVRILSGLISITTNFFLAKTLGPEGKGVISLLIMVVGLMVLIMSLGYQISGAYYASKSQYPRSDLLTTTILFTLLVSMGALILSAIFFQPLRTYVFHGVSSVYIIMILSVIPFYLFVFYMKDIFWAMSLSAYFVAVSLTTVIIYFLASVLLVGILKMGVTGAVWAFVSGFYAAGILALILALKIIQGKFTFNKDFLKHAVKYGLKVHFGRLSQQVTYRIDIPMVNYFSGFGSTGYYSIAVSLAELLWYIPRTISFVLFPRVARMEAEDASSMTAILIRTSLWGSLLFSIILYFGSTALITYWLPAYDDSLGILLLLIPGIVISNIFQLLTSDLLGRGKPALVSSISIVSGVIAVALYFLLIPQFGPLGAAASSSIVYSFQALLAIWMWVRQSNVGITELLVLKKSDFVYYGNIGQLLLQALISNANRVKE